MRLRQKWELRAQTGSQGHFPLRWRHLFGHVSQLTELSMLKHLLLLPLSLLLAACSLTQYNVSEGEINQYLKERVAFEKQLGIPGIMSSKIRLDEMQSRIGRARADRVELDAALRAPNGEVLGAIPASSLRADKTLSFDSSGNPIAIVIASQEEMDAAVQAAADAEAAAIAAWALPWVSNYTVGGGYVIGDVRVSPLSLGGDGNPYRCAQAANGRTVLPSEDPAYWRISVPMAPTLYVVTTSTFNASSWWHYILTNVAPTTITLPASPIPGDIVWVTVANGLATNRIGYNSGGDARTIMGFAEDMLIDSSVYATAWLRYVNATLGWRVV
jgi:hypothetical protein